MAIRIERGRGPRAVLFDFDETLIDNRRAWEYALEQSVLQLTGEGVEARALTEEYRRRSWLQAATIIVREAHDAQRVATLAQQMYASSAIKRLLVHEGVGMALDALRADGIEIAAISRYSQRLAVLQAQATGIDRFLAVLAVFGDDGHGEAVGRCLNYLGREPQECAFVAAHAPELVAASEIGLPAFEAGWAATEPSGFAVVASPGSLREALTAMGAPTTPP